MPFARFLFYAANIGAVVLAARAVIGHVPSFTHALLAVIAYAAISLASAVVLPWRVFVDALTRGPRVADHVAFTFDGVTIDEASRLAKTLDETDVKGTFFVRGASVEANAETLRAIASRDHAVGISGWDRDRWLLLRGPRRVHSDLTRAIEAVVAVTGVRPIFYRPPRGCSSPLIARIAEELELVVVAWSVRVPASIDGATSDERIDRWRSHLHRGAIFRIAEDPVALDEALRATSLEKFEIVSLERFI
jgi:peptidoglycan/xylan/chitin deacetylase (PgdA/CDA1 family)